MKTAVIQIGNSDDKLTQRDWSRFVKDVEFAVSASCGQIHFSGFSPGGEPWQNFCIVAQIDIDPGEDLLRGYLSELVEKYKQDSIALMIGETKFVLKKGQQI